MCLKLKSMNGHRCMTRAHSVPSMIVVSIVYTLFLVAGKFVVENICGPGPKAKPGPVDIACHVWVCAGSLDSHCGSKQFVVLTASMQ